MLNPIARPQIDPRVTALVPGLDAPFFLAGLVGYSDGAMRMLSRMYGAPFCVTESMRADTLLRGGKGLKRADPDAWKFESLTPIEKNLFDNRAMSSGDHPLAAQIIGENPDEMAQAAALMAELPYEVIDVNLACPPKKKRGSGCQGGELLAHTTEAIEILEAVRAAVPKHIPTTVKLRRAYDDTAEMARNFEIIFDAAYDLGYAWSTVHCRTVQQRYDGPGRWPFLTDLVRRHPDRIVFGSGDVWCAEDIFRLIDETGVHAAAVARGGIANPWIFQEARELLAGRPHPGPPTRSAMRTALERHHQLSTELNGPVTTLRMMRKFAIKLCEKHLPEGTKKLFVAVRSVEDWQAALTEALGPRADENL